MVYQVANNFAQKKKKKIQIKDKNNRDSKTKQK